MKIRTEKSPAGFLGRTRRATFAAALFTAAAFAAGAQEDVAGKVSDPVIAQAVKVADKTAALSESTEARPTTDPSLVENALPTSTNMSREKTDHDQRMELIGLSLGCVMAPLGIGIAFFALWIDYRRRHEMMVICHQERMAALEKGLELPPFPLEFCQSSMTPKPSVPGTAVPSTGLKAGLIWFAVGIGLWLFLSPKNLGFFHPSVGAIPGAIGVAHLIYYLLAGRKHSPGKGTTAP